MSRFAKSLSKSQVRKNDIYITPEELAKDIIDIITFKEGEILMDPSKGTGIFYDNFPTSVKKIFCEITEGLDFFEHKTEVDWIVGNPPWSLMTKWLDHTSDITRKGFLYIGPMYVLTDKRVDLLRKKSFELTWLESFRVKEWFGYPVCAYLFEKNKLSNRKLKYNY